MASLNREQFMVFPRKLDSWIKRPCSIKLVSPNKPVIAQDRHGLWHAQSLAGNM
jgi:hypothetical protein